MTNDKLIGTKFYVNNFNGVTCYNLDKEGVTHINQAEVVELLNNQHIRLDIAKQLLLDNGLFDQYLMKVANIEYGNDWYKETEER